VRPPLASGTFHLVVVAAMRVKQLARGCVPRVAGNRPRTVLARIEVAEGRVVATNTSEPPGYDPGAGPTSVARTGDV
jgi:DNA-directed RNA polymerase subunit K/omega